MRRPRTPMDLTCPPSNINTSQQAKRETVSRLDLWIQTTKVRILNRVTEATEHSPIRLSGYICPAGGTDRAGLL